MRRLLALVAVSISASAAWAAEPVLNRAAMVPVERQFDERFSRFNPDDPFFLMGTTRAIYLEGYGVVITAEVNLASGPGISPFRPEITKAEIARVHQQKIERLPKLRALMRDMLLGSALSLTHVPASEQVVLAVTLLNKGWEDTTGLPAQIVMQGQRKALVETRSNPETAAIGVKEY